MKNIKIIFFVTLFITMTLPAYVFQIQTFVKEISPEHTQYVHLLNDVHVEQFVGADLQKLAKNALKQKRELISVIKKYAPNSLVITETADAHIFDALKRMPHLQTLYCPASFSFLHTLAYVCEMHKIPAINVDHRVDHYLKADFNDIISKEQLYVIEQDAINALKKFNDTPALNAYYADIVARISLNQETLAIEIADTEYPDAADLIDAYALHSIASNTEAQHIFVCLGKGHAQNIRLRLQNDLGFIHSDTKTVNAKLKNAYENRYCSDQENSNLAVIFLGLCYRNDSLIKDYFDDFFSKVPNQNFSLAQR